MGESEETLLQAMEAGSSYQPASFDGLAATDHEPFTTADITSEVDDRVQIDRLLAKLSAESAAIVRLYFFDDMTQQEIGDRLHLSQVAVSRRLAKVITRMEALAGAAG